MMLSLQIAATSCSKDEEKSNEKTVKLLKEVSYNEVSYMLEYDSKNRAKRIVYYKGNEEKDITNITYNDNTITCTDNRSYEVYTLDVNGYVIKVEHSDGRYSECSYSNGYLSKLAEYNTNGTMRGSTTYTWSNGNLLQIKDDLGIETYIYSDHQNKMNVGYEVIASYDWLFRFKGMTSTNFHSAYSYNNGREAYIVEYTFDKDDYPIEILETYTPTGEKYVTTYTYY